jgi:molecular chaperone DnaK
MLLAEPPEVIHHFWGDAPDAPDEITRQFLAYLVTLLGVQPKEFGPIVVSVPDIWLRQSLLRKRDLLVSIFHSLGINVRVESEPVAAAAYYLLRFKEKYGKFFSGHLLVCDCGGGTLNFCLVKVSEGEKNGAIPVIEVLERAGNGMMQDHLGNAGVAFDHGVIQRLFPDASGEEFYRKVREFESSKITDTDAIRDSLQAYQKKPDTVEGEVIFFVDGKEGPVTAELLVTVFAERVRPGIDQARTELKRTLIFHQVAEHNPDSFRILMVGGFSLFSLVQMTVEKAFGSMTDLDKRFTNVFTLPDRAYAIVKGAALIADNWAKIHQTCPASVGVYASRVAADGKPPRWEKFPVLEKGKRIDDYHEPVWYPEGFQMGMTKNISCFFEPAEGDMRLLSTQEPFADIPPPDSDGESNVHIGFSINKNMVVYVHLRDSKQPEKMNSTSLGDLLEHMAGGQFTDFYGNQ